MSDLESFLSNHTVAANEIDQWGDIRLEVKTYLTDAFPSFVWITSVRAIVRRQDTVLVVRDPDRLHLLPGGRRENDEALDETLRREILEETGWLVAHPRLLGIKHFHHLTPKPTNYAYPYPDFLHLIFVVEASKYRAAARQENGYERSAEWVPLQAIEQFALSPSERVLLGKALA
jgi:ADP-ribose pyrophosphatase YjhB (NUDIX family)